MRPTIYDVDLEWRHGQGGRLVLQDEDMSTKTLNGWRRLNTLSHYGIHEQCVMSFIPKQNGYGAPCYQSCANCSSSYIYNGSIYSQTMSNGYVQPRTPVNACHLTLPGAAHYTPLQGDISSKSVPEIYLTRLLATKGTVQKYVDDFFNTILVADERFPPAIKWLFDLLDEGARRNGITDSEVLHAWKSNR